jgi:hypothetical protein
MSLPILVSILRRSTNLYIIIEAARSIANTCYPCAVERKLESERIKKSIRNTERVSL